MESNFSGSRKFVYLWYSMQISICIIASVHSLYYLVRVLSGCAFPLRILSQNATNWNKKYEHASRAISKSSNLQFDKYLESVFASWLQAVVRYVCARLQNPNSLSFVYTINKIIVGDIEELYLTRWEKKMKYSPQCYNWNVAVVFRKKKKMNV